MERKITIRKNGSVKGEQALAIADQLYDLLSQEGIDSVKAINIAVDVQEKIKPATKLPTVQRSVSTKYEIFYFYPLISKRELKIEVKWNSENCRELLVGEQNLLLGYLEKRIILPIQPAGITSFESLFARALVLAISVCLQAANVKLASESKRPFRELSRMQEIEQDPNLAVYAARHDCFPEIH